MTTCRDEALRWVHRYAIGGAAFAALPLPISTSAGLVAIETHMMAMVGEIYGENVGSVVTTAAGGSFAILGQGLKFLATRAVGFVPVIGPAIKMGIAGLTIVAIGRGVVGHFERKYPGKIFEKP
ncbi:MULTISPECIES: hypothetical protein [Sorangium]|uniref:DUF697 domain-containing protein n=1 Tax=Sorangium atrum TaxID=2995308 RepID=A0ABT5CFW5_9BACT|nr:hypothetical protein [Sorangium aterium]MDC0685322.1 hypothetical protein [Sorangium aterium]